MGLINYLSNKIKDKVEVRKHVIKVVRGEENNQKIEYVKDYYRSIDNDHLMLEMTHNYLWAKDDCSIEDLNLISEAIKNSSEDKYIEISLI